MPLSFSQPKTGKRGSRTLLATVLGLALVGGPGVFASATVAPALASPLQPTQLNDELPAQTHPGQSVIFTNTLSVGVTALSYQTNFMPGATFSTQWFRDGDPIAGATGASYTPVAEDGGHTLTVEWTSHVTGYQDLPVMSAGKIVSLQEMTGVSVSFTAGRSVGTTATVIATASNPATPTVTVQWFRGPSFDKAGGVEISGVSGSSYTLGSEDEGKFIWPVVTLSFPGFQPVVREASPGTSPITPGRINPGAVAVAGDPQYGGTGMTLSVADGTPGATYEIVEWLRNGTPIPGSAGLATYVPVLADIDARIAASVRVSAPGYTTDTVTSAHLWVEEGSITPGSALLAVNSQALGNRVELEDVLTVSPQGWTLPGLEFSVRWLDAEGREHGIGNALTIDASKIGTQLRAELTASAPGYTSEVVRSDLTPRILGKREVTLQQPAGGFQAGQSLTLTLSSLTPGETVTAILSPAPQQRFLEARGAADNSASAQVSTEARENGTAELTLTIPSNLAGTALLSVSPGDFSQLISVRAAPPAQQPEVPVDSPTKPLPSGSNVPGGSPSPTVESATALGQDTPNALAHTGTTPSALFGALALALLLLGAVVSGVRRTPSTRS